MAGRGWRGGFQGYDCEGKRRVAAVHIGSPWSGARNLAFSEATGYDRHQMSTVTEIEAAIPRLSPKELEELKAWFDDFYEDQLQLTDEVKQKLDQGREEIRQGNFRTRQP
jgi:hypothetical protein